MDEQILKILERDARVPVEKLAVMLGISADEAAAAVARLENSGILRGYRALVDWEKAGSDVVFAFIDVKVAPSKGVGYDDVASRIYKYPEVHSVYLVSGDYDLRVVVSGSNMREVAFFVAEALSPIEGVLSTRTNFMLRKYKEHGVIFGSPDQEERLAVAP